MQLCSYCIMAIRSRGEKVFVGDVSYADDEPLICGFCNEEFDELLEVGV